MEIGANHNPNLPVVVCEAPPPPPVGYRFLPTDFELLDHYLRKLIHEQPLSEFYPRIIHANIYADHPSAIWNLGDAHDDTGNGSELHCYVFTELESIGKGGSGKKMIRRVGAQGTWHISSTKNTKVNNGDQVLGYNKYFNYRPIRIHPGDVEYDWGMHEFTLHGSHDSTYHALCKITRRMRKKPLKGVVDEPVMLSNQQEQGDHIGFGEILPSSKRGDPAKQPNLEISQESITCSFNEVSAHDEILTPSPGSSSTTLTSAQLPHQQPLSGNTNQAHTAALLDRLSQFKNSDFNDDVLLCETQEGHPQQLHKDHSQGSIVATPSDTYELEDFDDIFLELSSESITCSSNKVPAHDEIVSEIVSPSVGSSSSSATTFTSTPLSHQQPLLGNTNQAHTAALLDPLSQFENSDFNDDVLLCETQEGHPQQLQMDHSQGSMVTTPSDSFELEDFDNIFLDLGDFIQLEDVREEDYYQPKVGSIGCQQISCKRARVEEGAGCAEYDQHMHDARADGAKKCRHC